MRGKAHERRDPSRVAGGKAPAMEGMAPRGGRGIREMAARGRESKCNDHAGGVGASTHMKNRLRPALAGALTVLLFLGATLYLLPLKAASFPGSDSGHGTWTGEVAVSLSGARQAQAAHSNGYVVMAADNGQDVYLYRASDELTLNWGAGTCMDLDKSRQACDPYLAASGKYVALSFKEAIDGRWALVIRCSWDGGATWPKTYIDQGASWNNYEAHLALAGNMVHAAYASDYPGRMEVYYLRLDLSLNRQALSCASDSGDARAATTPWLACA